MEGMKSLHSIYPFHDETQLLRLHLGGGGGSRGKGINPQYPKGDGCTMYMKEHLYHLELINLYLSIKGAGNGRKWRLLTCSSFTVIFQEWLAGCRSIVNMFLMTSKITFWGQSVYLVPNEACLTAPEKKSYGEV